MGKFGMNLREARRSLPQDFPVLLKADRIRKQEQEYTISLQAWQNQAVQATTGSGKSAKSKYRSFNDFYNNSEQFNSIFGIGEEIKGKERVTIADRNRMLNKTRGKGRIRRRRDIALMNRLINNKSKEV